MKYEIPGMSEMIVQAFVERDEEESKNQGDLIFEPTEEFRASHSLLVAPAILNIAKRVTVPLRVMNPFNHSLMLYQDTVIGTAEDIQDCIVREVVTDLAEIRNVTECQGGMENQSGTCNNEILPQHLQALYENSITSLSNSEKQEYRTFLLTYQDVFSKDEWDLGQTNLAEQTLSALCLQRKMEIVI